MESAQAAGPERKQGPWGFWPTIGWSVVVFLVYVGISVAILFAIGAAYSAADPNADIEEFVEAAATNGFVAFLGISLAAPLCTGLVLLLIKFKATLSVEEYLCLVPVGARTALIWFAFLALVLIGSDLLTYSLGRPIVPEVMVELYRTSHFVALPWFAVIIAGPIFEEVFFRGFMFRGIEASGLGNGGAILITAFTWAAIHTQYDGYLLATIFVLGILLGLARAVTGSLYLTTAMHAVTNAIATIEIHLFAGS
ncbi:MAG: CPBP family intramembrane metalloprotease [Proteobacteria bacterium]|nr:CPBP family intramembrane metalloprotease [Pseudomonadota bacterium]